MSLLLTSHLPTVETLIQTHPVNTGLGGAGSEDTMERGRCRLGFDRHCGQPSRFESEYHAFDTTFIFHHVSVLLLRE